MKIAQFYCVDYDNYIIMEVPEGDNPWRDKSCVRTSEIVDVDLRRRPREELDPLMKALKETKLQRLKKQIADMESKQ